MIDWKWHALFIKIISLNLTKCFIYLDCNTTTMSLELKSTYFVIIYQTFYNIFKIAV